MYYILYNEKSNKGKPVKIAAKLLKKYNKKRIDAEVISIISLIDKEKEFSSNLKNDDVLIIIGGDGTFHQFFNKVYPLSFNCKVYALSYGRGNDFARDYKKHKIFEITHLFNNLPVATINDNEKYLFVNGVGMGVDSGVCNLQLQNAKNNIKQSYFKVALKVFKTFKPYKLDIKIDGNDYHFDNVWFFVCNNGKYFGGGMKVTPKAVREDDVLDICVVHSIKRWRLLLIFPTIFVGLHNFFGGKNITNIRGKQVEAKPDGCNIMQRDGEVSYNVNKLSIKR